MIIGIAAVVATGVWLAWRPPAGPTSASFLENRREGQVASAAPAGLAFIQDDPNGRRVQTPAYEALVEKDGCLTSLKVGGVEFLKPGLGPSRGAFFYERGARDEALKLPDVKHPSANVLTAEGDKAFIRYDFAPNVLTLTLKNKAPGEEQYFLTFDPGVTAVIHDGQSIPVPVKAENWTTITAVAGGARLKITGSTQLWGPWIEPVKQMWECRLQPGETRTVTLQVVGYPNGGVPAFPHLVVQSPKDYQVFQRGSRSKGDVVVRGQAPADCDRVEARVTGTDLDGKALPGNWQEVHLDEQSHRFEGPVSTPAGGWYQAEVRALKGGQETARKDVSQVGVGEVFVIAGQSNSANFGAEKQHPETGMVSTFDGNGWRPADDPQPGAQDNSLGGSPWPAFGDALYRQVHVPVGIASTGHGGSSVVQWQSGDKLFQGMMKRIQELGPHGFRALLWHQGEQDAMAGTKGADYARLLTNVIQASRQEAGWDVPWFVAHVSYVNPDRPSNTIIREAQKELWDKGIALEGPDTDTLTGDERSGIHLSGKGLRHHGRLWAEKVGPWLQEVLKK